ncbi:hypothetical protein AFL01nite_25480 [Aeromicrobium flavum]|uniref:Lipoprotein n=1 Tax=Aeromicrobium flavum TaxID=416568 RepID=A0A512HXP7_9ACTN|nr:hypothetical protein [Aeromicrobium flavum]GEO90221.1 hypothetical protein AFL01nite_25480 [Aeromicrobium flavum]
MNRRFTRVALLAATALTLSLASPVAAQADESGAALAPSTTASQQSLASRSGSAATAANALSTFKVRHGAIVRRGNNPVAATFVPSVNGSGFRADVYVNGRLRGQVPLVYTNQFNYTGAWGIGTVRLGPVRYVDTTGRPQVSFQYSNTFRIRQGLYVKKGLKQFKLSRKGNKVTMRAQSVRSFNGAKYVSVGKAVIQVKSGRKWKKFKTLKLNKNGHSKKIKFTRKGKRTYRLYIPTTTKVLGGSTKGIRM